MKNNKTPDSLANAVLFLDEHYTDDVTLVSVARSVKVSPACLSLRFKKELGVPFRNYLNRLRTDRAKELLETTSFSVLDVAFDCGYKDQSYFTKVFKKYVGTTPIQYKRRLPRKLSRCNLWE